MLQEEQPILIKLDHSTSKWRNRMTRMVYIYVDTGSNPVFDKIEFMWCEEHLHMLIVLDFV